jgi:hypothetical protein
MIHRIYGRFRKFHMDCMADGEVPSLAVRGESRDAAALRPQGGNGRRTANSGLHSTFLPVQSPGNSVLWRKYELEVWRKYELEVVWTIP